MVTRPACMRSQTTAAQAPRPRNRCDGACLACERACLGICTTISEDSGTTRGRKLSECGAMGVISVPAIRMRLSLQSRRCGLYRLQCFIPRRRVGQLFFWPRTRHVVWHPAEQALATMQQSLPDDMPESHHGATAGPGAVRVARRQSSAGHEVVQGHLPRRGRPWGRPPTWSTPSSRWAWR
jgi:hypothetical protein